MPLKALVTGFEVYGGRGINPAAEVSRALDGTRVGPLEVTGVCLPVSLDDAPGRLTRLIDQLAPDITLCLGLWLTRRPTRKGTPGIESFGPAEVLDVLDD